MFIYNSLNLNFIHDYLKYTIQELKNDTEEKRKLLDEIEQLRKEEQEIKKQITKFSGVDPEVIAEMDEKAQV